ncbi:hypothetical protein BSZ39_10860 [Bowdeniella nasicola]|uniref:CopC domain-containing protein n=1 Tax=Bowdeniella nasicola TaxID=208480 RepID=A0A1Q5Q0F3_9ACTO|nr:copper resistance CopC family protein [Bowdeniella nasicola]OKL53185.1 hypothetical protein BSZ39_10860 [Bowdeniella nasicola]
MLPVSCAVGAPDTTRRSAWVCRITAILAIVMFIAALTAPVARAHDVLVNSSPSEGEQLDTAPTTLRLEFNNELLDLGSNAAAVVLTNANNEQVATGPLAISGREATYDLPALSDGAYAAAWSVVSSDGHRIQGKIAFSVGDPNATPAPKDSPTSSESTAAAEQPAAAATTTPASDNDAENSSTFAGLPRAALIAIALGIVASMVLIILKLRRN